MSEDPDTIEERVLKRESDLESNAELAQAWLTRELGDTNQRLNEVTHSIEFNSRYEPTPPGPRPHPEAGGMDMTDWQVERLEYENWPMEREEELQSLEAEDEMLSEKLSDLLYSRDRLENGDPQVIARLAALEKARQKDLEKQEKIRKVKEEGLRLDGANEVIGKIKELKAAEKGAWKKDPNSHRWDALLPTPNGWNLVSSPTRGHRYAYQQGKGPLGLPLVHIQIVGQQFTKREEGEVVLRYQDLSNMKAKKTKQGIKTDEPGLGLYFSIKDDLVKDLSAVRLEPQFQFGTHGDIEIRATGKSTIMTQEHFNRFRSHLNSLVEGVKASSNQ